MILKQGDGTSFVVYTFVESIILIANFDCHKKLCNIWLVAECDHERRSRVSEENEFLRFRFNCNHLIMLKYCSVIHSYTQIVVFFISIK